MRLPVIAVLVALPLVGCTELSKPHPLRVSKDPTGKENQMGVAPSNLVKIPGPDGKPVQVPRLHPPGAPSAGMPVMPGEPPQRAPTAAPAASAAKP